MSIAVAISPDAPRTERYRLAVPALKALMDVHAGPVANMANTTALIKEAFGFHWVGFYLVQGEELILGPFQGPPACTRIPHGKGVCGTAWAEGRTIVVPDVDLYPGHIACSPLSRSEIVVPLTVGGKIIGVLDIDSEHLADFSEVDIDGLIQLLQQLLPCL